jgi:hypothetical protein
MNSYIVSNLEGFAESLRDNVAKGFAEDYKENLDEFVSIVQVIGIIKEYTTGETLDKKPIITEDAFNHIYDDLRVRMYEVGLAKLAASGYIECAWNQENNEMEFWLPDKDKTKIEAKPSDYE